MQQQQRIAVEHRGPLFTPHLIAATFSIVVLAASVFLLAYRPPSRVAPVAPPNVAAKRAPEGPPRASAVAAPLSSAKPQASEAHIAIGRKIFADRNLSEPAGTSCASCHDPTSAYAGNNGSKRGVAAGSRENHFARRNTPSVLYLKFVRRFHFRWDEDEPLPEAFGGFFWDGRSDSIASLVRQPLLNPDEMGNRDPAQIAEKLAAAPYADDLRREFGDVFTDPEKALAALGAAVEAFLLAPEMAPFTSKYDAFIRGQAALSAIEAKGLAIFKDRQRGGCDACHKMNDRSPNPEFSLFTDYGYDIVGVPRNRSLPGNRHPQSYDLGLCERKDPRSHTDEERLCGAFRTPSLRNVATRTSFMHNGTFTNLRDVVGFYATRATHPARWYKAGVSFDDLPEKYRGQVNVTSVPYNRRPGQRPLLNDEDIDAIVAFLKTLTDAQYIVDD